MTSQALTRELVTDSDKLVEVLGYWPSFHDAHVLELRRAQGTVTAWVHVFEMTGEIDANGCFVLRRHVRVELAMRGVKADSLPPAYAGDVLARWSVERAEGLLRACFESHMDNDGEILCEQVRVLSVEAC